MLYAFKVENSIVLVEVNGPTASLYYQTGRTVSLFSDTDIMRLVDMFLAPIGQSNFETLSDYNTACVKSQEDTLVLKVA